MTRQWRELIEAYVSGRLSADGFKRRFLDAHADAVRTRAPTHPAVQDLAYVVEAYAGDPTGRGHDVADDDDLLRAAKRALSALPEDVDAGAPGPATPEDIRAAEAEMRTTLIRAGAIGGAGCLFALAWLVIGVLQFFAVAAQLQSVTGWGPAPSTLVSVPVTFIPVVGSVTAFFGAKDVWGWAPWLSALAFLVVPAITLFGGWSQMSRGGRR
ncbi:MAG: hypothetical protein JNM47_00320 [Hyphomonadaceae bacterium]|nr:hypothetical protein [Hyphomonadaceae bacterium]